MNAIIFQDRIPKLADVYPPFAQKMEEFRTLANCGDQSGADRAFGQAQVMAKAFYAGADAAMEQAERQRIQERFTARVVKEYLVQLCEEGAIGPITLRRALEDLGIKDQ